MHTQTVTAMFEHYVQAANAVERLKAAGVAQSDISLVGRNRTTSGSETVTLSDDTDRDGTSDTAENAGTGASLGAAIGGGAGLLAGLGMMAIPGIGPVVAAGWLAATLAGAAAGGAAGGIIGALTSAGVPEDRAHEYAEGLRRGAALVTVQTEDAMVGKVVDILDDEGTIDMPERAGTWRNEGWTGRYDAPAGGTSTSGVPGVPGNASGDRRSRVSTYPAGTRTDVDVDDQRSRDIGRRDLG